MNNEITSTDRVTTNEQLDALYDSAMSLALLKEIDHVSDHYRAFVEKSPFVIVATAGPEGLDCSPRGDPPGFVRVVDPKTVMMPDRRGNNRIDTLRNIVRDPRISLLFLIPGVSETLRINGHAEISVDPELCASFAMDDKLPKSVIVIRVDRVYFQCAKSLIRSKLWSADAQIPRTALPSSGQILEALSNDDFNGEEYDCNLPDRLKKTMY